ncbi:2-dehydro-3-deoxyglucarate aldolase [Micromonospora sp. ATA32]|nr:2-dehydro-3-deoxyglucarate aldolase [Micromonospora sp. ATA32]
MIRFLELVHQREGLLGTWIKLPCVESVELMALAGFDFIVLDLEHSPMSLQTASTLVAVANGRGLAPLIRTPDHSPAVIQRCLDAGASGVVVPHVDNPEQAATVGRAARFEPAGTRGVGPTSRAGDWGLSPVPEYLGSDAHAAVVAQIESAAGVRAAAQIASDGHADALFVGTADLSVSLGRPADHPDVTDLVQQVVDDCRGAGLPCGTATGADPRRANTLFAQGFTFVMLSNDATMLGAGARDLVSGARAAAAERTG